MNLWFDLLMAIRRDLEHEQALADIIIPFFNEGMKRFGTVEEFTCALVFMTKSSTDLDRARAVQMLPPGSRLLASGLNPYH